MPNQPTTNQPPLPLEHDQTFLYCPKCGKLVGILDDDTGDLYVIHKPQDKCYATTDKGVQHG